MLKTTIDDTDGERVLHKLTGPKREQRSQILCSLNII